MRYFDTLSEIISREVRFIYQMKGYKVTLLYIKKMITKHYVPTTKTIKKTYYFLE